MKVEIGIPDFAKVMREAEGGVARAATVAMRATTGDALRELRGQVTSAGLGQRLANTWRGNVYPKSRNGMNPAGSIYSRAPDIIESFVRGATIVPVNGTRFLAIPTDNVPRALGRRGSSRRMTPAQVEHTFNQDLFYQRGKNGRVLAFINAVGARRGRGIRQGTKRRLAQGRALKRVLMFTLVPAARMPKLLDLEGPAARWSAAYIDAFTRGLEKDW
ncbi:DUF6441 family protein [Sphingomonas sp. MJ1 (PH-R8)]|uniref:DUF6441 family protein n=1 Tax=Sphingomonas sp. MJ1 (PH-R8) TaxID=3112950 RepID=UPI003A89E404